MFACIPVRARTMLTAALGLALALAVTVLPRALPVDAKGTPVPILMYHSVLRDEARAGRYIISPAVVESDLRYLSERGYTAMFASELAEAVLQGEALPQKPVVITFDDGYLNNLTYVLPLLERYDMKAVVNIVGSYSERFSEQPDHNPAYAHLCWEDVTALVDSGRVEIGNHTYDMHRQSPRKGAMRRKGESGEDYYEALMSDVGRTQSLLEEHCGILPTTFAYPFGHISEESIPILREMGFTALLTCTEQVNVITGDPEALLALGRFNRPSGLSTEKFMKRMDIN